jgi:class 3 adenylate cyclase/tetratricopeptide (TPR) repeat protein
VPCPSCAAPNPSEHRFCHACGAALGAPQAAALGASEAPAAPDPRARVRDPRAYTPAHLAEKILTSKSAIEGERKRVTVVFMDVEGFTSLSEHADPEQMHALMDRCFRIILEQVHHFEGTVNQFTGDGVMALFGAPIALEDAPRRAVSAALRVQAALEPLRREVRAQLDADFRLRIGIHTGLVVVGRIGDDLRMDYTAVGDTTNLAARLQQLAHPGSVLLSEATAHLVSGFFELRELGELGVKGRSAPVRAYEALSERPVADRVEAAAQPDRGSGLTPYVGRERELEALLAAFDSAREGHGQVVFLVGEAGMGKSRLLHEFRQRIGGASPRFFEGRCTSYGRATAFGPIIDGMRRGFGIQERDDDETALARIERAEAELGGELGWTLPYVRALLSLPERDPTQAARLAAMDPGTRRSETLRALQARFLRAAERAPLVCVIEDVHWIDPASEEALTFFSDSVPTSRLLLVLTHRPGYRPQIGDRSFHARIALQPLSAVEMAAMAESALEATELPEELRRLIAEKAEGNPFFIEEVARSLCEQGALRVEEGRATLAADGIIVIPDRIQDVLMARLDRLSDAPKHAIQVASVIGREFALRLLERIHEASEALEPIVTELRALELIYEKASHPELAYMFKHALTHDVAYESVLVERRKALHRVVGAAIEELYRDRLAEHYDALAHHFSAGEDWLRAFHYHEAASQKAALAYANHSAAEHCRAALAIAERLDVAGEPVPRARLQELAQRLADACMSVSDFRASGDAHLLAAEWSETPTERAASLSRAAYALHWAHDYERARATTDEANRVADQSGSTAEVSRARLVRTFRAMTGKGLVDFDEGPAEAVLEMAAGDPEVEAFVGHHVGEAAEWRGEYARAIELQGSALAIAKRLGLPYLLVQCRWFLAKAHCCLGDYERALALLREALDVSDRVGDRAWKTRLHNTLGWCLAEVGAHHRSREHNRLSTEFAGQLVKLDLVPGAPELYGNAAVNLAANERALGETEAALDRLEGVREELEKPGDPWMRWRYEMHVWDGLAATELARGRPEVGLAWLDRELESARVHGSRKIESRSLELRGRCLVAMDERAAALAALAEALTVAAAIGYPPVQWRVHALLAELARRSADDPAARRHAAEAARLVERHAGMLSDDELRSGLRALGERLVADPLSALV